jgi:hypothetical protein
MSRKNVSVALSARLGPAATTGLIDLIESEQKELRDDVMTQAVDRFERRLTEQVSGLRVDILRELHEGRVEIIKWSFLFWIGQAAIIIGLVVGLWRLAGR